MRDIRLSQLDNCVILAYGEADKYTINAIYYDTVANEYFDAVIHSRIGVVTLQPNLANIFNAPELFNVMILDKKLYIEYQVIHSLAIKSDNYVVISFVSGTRQVKILRYKRLANVYENVIEAGGKQSILDLTSDYNRHLIYNCCLLLCKVNEQKTE
jgi:hypothetical protein